MSPLHKISYLDDLFHYKLGVIIIRYVCCCLNIVRISVVDIVYLTKNLSYTEAPKKESMLIWVYYKAWTKMTWHPAKSPDPVLQTTSFCSAGSNQSAWFVWCVKTHHLLLYSHGFNSFQCICCKDDRRAASTSNYRVKCIILLLKMWPILSELLWLVAGQWKDFFFKRGLEQTGLLQAGSVGQVTFSTFWCLHCCVHYCFQFFINNFTEYQETCLHFH